MVSKNSIEHFSNLREKLNFKTIFVVFSYISVVVFAFWLRVKDINLLRLIIFDEKFYVKDGYSILKYGYEKQWVENYYLMGTSDWEETMAENSMLFSQGVYSIASEEYFSSHPPLGKFFIALGMFFAGYDTPFGWRFASIMAGTIIVILTMIFGFILTRNHYWALLAGGFVAVDGLNITMSRVGYLDIFLTMMILLAAIFVYFYVKKPKSRGKYLFLFSFTAGLAMGIKWSTLYFFSLFFILLLFLELRKTSTWSYAFSVLKKFFVSGVIFVAAYLSTWILWFFSYALPSTGNVLGSVKLFVSTHVDSLTTLRAATGRIPNDSYFLEWVTVTRPSFLFYNSENDTWAIMASVPNMLLWYVGWLSIILIIIMLLLRKIDKWLEPAFLVFTIFTLWVPWALHYDRIMFQYYSVAFAPYLYLLIIYVFVVLSKKMLNYKAVRMVIMFGFVFLVLLFTYLFYPLNSGTPQETLFYVNVLFQWYDIMEPLKIVFK